MWSGEFNLQAKNSLYFYQELQAYGHLRTIGNQVLQPWSFLSIWPHLVTPSPFYLELKRAIHFSPCTLFSRFGGFEPTTVATHKLRFQKHFHTFGSLLWFFVAVFVAVVVRRQNLKIFTGLRTAVEECVTVPLQETRPNARQAGL